MKKYNIFTLVGLIIAFPLIMGAQIPPYISQQGFIADSNGTPVQGIFHLEFNFYTDSIGGSALLTIDQPSVNVLGGIYSTTLDVSSLPFNQGYWMETKVNGEVQSPRLKLTSLPYALISQNVIGRGCIANDTGAIAMGTNNQALGTYSSVTSGYGNVAKGYGGDILIKGKKLLQIEGLSDFVGSHVCSGLMNTAAGDWSCITGGMGNSINGYGGYLGAGVYNGIYGRFGVVCGGLDNTCGTWGNPQYDYSVIVGGEANTVLALYSSIVGGRMNKIDADPDHSFIGGGYHNGIMGSYSFIGGGYNNQAEGTQSTICGGLNNAILSPTSSFIGGGDSNRIHGGLGWATIGGGLSNATEDGFSVIGGGKQNHTREYYSTIGGGSRNFAGGLGSTIAGGINNFIDSLKGYSAIGGGDSNRVTDMYGTIPGGRNNSAGYCSFAAGRRANAWSSGTFVWADATDQDFYSSASYQFLIRAGGGVGILSTSPVGPLNAKLKVDGLIWSTGDGYKFPDGSIQSTAATSGSPSGWTDDGTVVRLISSSDNVGIGTATPSAKLHVSASSGEAIRGVSSSVQSGVVGINNASSSGGPGVTGVSTNSYGILGMTNNNAAAVSGSNGGSGAGLSGENGGTGVAIEGYANTGDILKLYTTPGPSLKFIVNNNGNVGIGTATPSAKLQVVGDISIGYANSYQLGGYTALRWNSGNGSVAVGSTISIVPLELYAGSASPRVSVSNTSGNVGIAVTDPSEKIDVNGTARLRSMPTGTGTTVVADANGVLMKQSSSRRYKSNVNPLEVDAEMVLALKPVRFRWKSTGQDDIGLIAEDVEGVLNELVIYDSDKKPDGVKYDRVALYLLEVVKHQERRIDNLEDEVKSLKKYLTDNQKEVSTGEAK